MSTENQERIYEVIATVACIDKSTISPEQNLFQDLNLDSLDRIELVMEVEKAFNILVADEKVENVSTVQDVLDVVEEYASKKQLKQV